MGETFGQAIIDTGCPHTVSGEVWFNSYLNSLSRRDRSSIKTKTSNNKYRFGDGKLYSSKYQATIPIYIQNSRYSLKVDVVQCNVPLLLSRETLKRGDAKVDIGASTMDFLGVHVPLLISSTGHMCLPISRSIDILDDESEKVISRLFFTSPIQGVGSDIKNKANKLHIQFCHPTAERLIDLIKKAGVCEQRVFDTIRDITSSCDVCIRNKKAPLRPAVGLPTATQFNEMVAIDLKSRGADGYIMHMIDHLTRYSSACLIKNKKKETIVNGLLNYWVRIFGFPKSFLTDNGGEFINKEMMDFAEKYNINLKTTAAESAWSNGLVERHNGILNDNINKIIGKGISLDSAMHWAVAAKNSLANVYGFSPNILVFGKNPNFPSSFINKPPANNPVCLNDYVAENLNAMHLARKAFIEQESCERLRRALNRKTRTYSNNVFCQGDKVYYWRNNQSECHGPGVVIGKDGQQVLVKHGGVYIRVHPCRIQLCNQTSQSQPVESQLPSSSNHSNNHSSNHDINNPTIIQQSLNQPSNQSSNQSYEDDSDVYETADENDVPAGSNENDLSTNEINAGDDQTNSSDGWICVKDRSNLPAVNSNIECVFPNDCKIKCKVISKAGKSSTASWHFMNIKQNDESKGKCCSFKNVSWRHVSDDGNDSNSSHEVFYGPVDSNFDKAKNDEIDKWKMFKTFVEVADQGQKAINTRWVCTRKIKGGKVVMKARLVARGFEENNQHFQKDSPTCSKELLRICLAMISCQGWKLHSLDVKSAFLQGLPMEREVHIRPPKEAKSDCLWKMLRCPYGLSDAGRHWYLRLKKELLGFGMKSCRYDQAVFVWFFNNAFSGVLACHVDDIVFGGCKQFHNDVISKLRSTFVIGLEEDTNLKYLGLSIKQNGQEIRISTDDYGKSLKPLVLPESESNKNSCFSSEQLTTLKQFCGQLNWISTQGRPDISFYSCYLANSIKSGDLKVFSYANKVVRKIHNQSVNLFFPRCFDLDSLTVVSFCDASFGNLPNAGSQGAFLSFIVDKNGKYSLIAWQSKKIRRVVKSTIAAECLAAVEAAEMTTYIAAVIRDILSLPKSIDTILFCDNKNLVSAVHSSTNLEDRRLVIDVSVIRDLLQQHELTHFKWIATEFQVANTLTKQGASDNLLLKALSGAHMHMDCDTGLFSKH